MANNIKVALCFPLAPLIASCQNTPTIGEGLPRSFAKADPVFNARIKEHFPVGSSEAVMVTELKREGFTLSRIDPDQRGSNGFEHEATRIGNMGITCNLSWNVVWVAKEGAITVIQGNYFATCL